MVNKFAHSIKSTVLSLSSSTSFLFPLDSGCNTHSKVANTLIFAQSTFPLLHVLVTFVAQYALESLLLLPQSDCYHFDFWQVTGSSCTVWIHLTKSQHMRGRPEPFFNMSLVILRYAFEVFYCFLQQAHNVQTD